MVTPSSEVGSRPGVIVVGSGLTFLSGISVYTHQLAQELSGSYDVAAILMSKLVPRFLYPGGRRVGAKLSSLSYDDIPHVNVDWYWGNGIVEAARMIRARRPRAVIFQWWTAATAHSYLVLAEVARSVGAQVIIEFHEVQDPGEAGFAPLAVYGKFAVRRLIRHAHGVLIHHEHDADLLRAVDPMEGTRIELACHPPYGYLANVEPKPSADMGEAEPGVTTFLLFGVIRPRKGFETAVAAFQRLPDEVAERCRLLVIGEVWEGLAAEVEKAKLGKHADRITIVDRYVSDEEAAGAFDRADVVLLPYLESSSSGPMALAQAFGLPFLYSDLRSLRAAVDDYVEAQPVAVGDAAAWSAAIADVAGRWNRANHTLTPVEADWGSITGAYDALLQREAVSA